MRVTVIGCGYVGLTTSVALAYIGHHVHCIDQSDEKIKSLQNGVIPFFETGLEELLKTVGEKISFGNWDTIQGNCDALIIAVGTPRKSNGDADLSYVEAAATELAHRLQAGNLPVIVNKSTVPIGTTRRVESIVRHHRPGSDANNAVLVASCPEFLREGAALFDTFYPDRIIVGANDQQAVNTLREMYSPILEQTFTPPEFLTRPERFTLPAFITTTPTSAELIKYAANAFLAMKISYINEIAGLSERMGADIREIARGIGLDRRIGMHYLQAGIGWGDSCFGKDIQALIHAAEQYDYRMPLCSATILVNIFQREEIIRKLQTALKVIRGSTIGMLGLSFKPGTNDLRDAPSITIASRLIDLGAHVKVYDPVAMKNCSMEYPELPVEYTDGPLSLASGTDALVLVTEWEEFIHLPYAKLGERMNQKVIIDGRNVLDGNRLQDAGFIYAGIGC